MTWISGGCDDHREAFARLVNELVCHYCHRAEVGEGALLTVHADDTDDMFTLQIGVGRDAAAWMMLAEQRRHAGGA